LIVDQVLFGGTVECRYILRYDTFKTERFGRSAKFTRKPSPKPQNPISIKQIKRI